MSTHDLRDKLDGINNVNRMDSIFPEPMSRLHRGIVPGVVEGSPQSYKRKIKKNMDRNRGRFRTQPVTFMEIKEVDEENPEHLSFSGNNNSSKRVQRLTGASDEENLVSGTSTSSMDITTDSEANVRSNRRGKSHSELELKRSFEEFARNFTSSLTRSGSGNIYDNRVANNLNNNFRSDTTPQSSLEAAENEDQVGGLKQTHHIYHVSHVTSNQILRAQADRLN